LELTEYLKSLIDKLLLYILI